MARSKLRGIASARPCRRGKADNRFLTKGAAQVEANSKKDRQMWLYVQTWLPVLTIALTAAICFSVASFIMGQSKPQS
jgi:hypothetical protein